MTMSTYKESDFWYGEKYNELPRKGNENFCIIRDCGLGMIKMEEY